MNMPTLDPARVPSELRSLLPWAERWGIGDDGYREEAIESATTDDLAALARCLDDVPDETITNWLTGPDSRAKPLSAEYLAITCLTMAVHSAKASLKRR